MIWRFTLINNRTGKHYRIDEPVGWDQLEILIKRDSDKHGIFLEYQTNDLEFDGRARRLIEQEYRAYGVQGDMSLLIEQACEGADPMSGMFIQSEDSQDITTEDDEALLTEDVAGGPRTFLELYRGKLNFADYSATCGATCSVRVPIEDVSETVRFKNLFDQKVDLKATTTFEGKPLPAYGGLNREVIIPSKSILITNHGINEKKNGTIMTPIHTNEPYDDHGMISIGLERQVAGEVGSFYPEPQPLFDPSTPDQFQLPGHPVRVYPLSLSPIVNYNSESPSYNFSLGLVTCSFRMKGTLYNSRNTNGGPAQGGSVGITSMYLALCRLPENKTGESVTDYEWLEIRQVALSPFIGDGVRTFDEQYTGQFALNRGDRLYWFAPAIWLRSGSSWDTDGFIVEFDTDAFFRMQTLSAIAPTPCRMFMVNEAISRVTEVITENRMRAYSQYFGRTDSQPYRHVLDGCGSLEAITRGLYIRRQENRNGGVVMALSMKDLWEGLEPIHHIGLGIEPDDQRPGFDRLRVENWRYFYQPSIGMELHHVGEIKRRCVENEHYSAFTFGYQRWEAEEYNGLDEFLTKRTYRTGLTAVRSELSKLSRFIASGYGWEVTRRKGTESKDWRYDNETFILCLKRVFSKQFTYLGEVGENFIVFPELTDAPDWMVPGQSVEITMEDNMGNTFPGNAGTFLIDNVDFPSGQVRLIVAGTFSVFPLDVFVTLTVGGFNDLEVEQGNVSNPQHIIDPDSVYNFRISPVRNALRWMDKVLASFRSVHSDNKLYFTDGEGNYNAAGALPATPCRLEGGVLTENQPLSIEVFQDPAKASPLLRPERDLFDYPMSVRDFRLLRRNRYGKIAYSNDSITGVGWIDQIKYKPEEGMASFEIIPAYSLKR
jgi:hypothetical protein